MADSTLSAGPGTAFGGNSQPSHSHSPTSSTRDSVTGRTSGRHSTTAPSIASPGTRTVPAPIKAQSTAAGAPCIAA
ncbi:hypothetical protein ACPPVO_23420 [Dactylosporangium sp. McL0621]|uniref:hypothetical protein n=1 Tax=Dactylosporangium sp. McL0621 TaxID=3415678 RepID=UPI003CED1B18